MFMISLHIPLPTLYNMVCTDFRDNQDPPPPQVPPSPPDPRDEEHMDARLGPDQEEMEEAINSFLQQLDKQEMKGFKDLASLLSLLPKPAKPCSVGSISVGPGDQGWVSPFKERRAWQYVHCQNFDCTSTLRTTGQPGISRDNLFYLVLSWNIFGYPNISQYAY